MLSMKAVFPRTGSAGFSAFCRARNLHGGQDLDSNLLDLPPLGCVNTGKVGSCISFL